MFRFWVAASAVLGLAYGFSVSAQPGQAYPGPSTWTADNGNGTFSNPLFFDEFSDPDLIRVGDDYYMTGTTMHAMPGLPILHSKDLVNWRLISYAMDTLDLGPRFRLEDGQDVYGQGIWAPSLRYHNGTFYIFSNVNGEKTQIFSATNPAGPWTRKEMKHSLHDLSVLFDDDGKIYAIWGYQGIKMVELTPDLTDIVPGSEREIIPPDAGIGEGVHFYKYDGKYYITSSWYAGLLKMPAARADKIDGPYEVNPAISIDEDFGMVHGHRLASGDVWAKQAEGPYEIAAPDRTSNRRMAMHQGGIVQTPSGEWWGFSMMDFNSIGRLVGLSPITWHDGWPYFGLPGNLTRTPRTWVKPDTGYVTEPRAPYERTDHFSERDLKPVWQWNHVPLPDKWSLSERPGFMRLKTQPAKDFWWARNTLTQRAVGPVSQPTATLDATHLKDGDVAGMGLLNRPYTWIGVEKTDGKLSLVYYNQQTVQSVRVPLNTARVWLRADADFITEKARFSYSTDGKTFVPIGDELTMVFQLKTFQGVRYALFAYNTKGAEGGYADFDSMEIHEPHPRGLRRAIPYGQTITVTERSSENGLSVGEAKLMKGRPAVFTVEDMSLGRAALRTDKGYVSVAADGSVSLREGTPGAAESFQWIETPGGELALMSLVTNRFLRIDPQTGAVTADSPGPQANNKDGANLNWQAAEKD